MCVARGDGLPVAMVDTVGAGDAFVAALLAGQAAHWPLALRLARANQFGAAACGWRGAVSPDPDLHARWRAHWSRQVPGEV